MRAIQTELPLDKIGLSAGFLTALGWGVAGIFIQLLPSISAYSIVATRLLIALLIFIPLLLLKGKSLRHYFLPLQQPITWALSVFLFACYTLGTMSLQLAPVGEATLLMTTAPLFVILFKWLLKEPTSRYEIMGALLAITGIFIVILPSLAIDNELNKDRIIGDILALLVSIIFAVFALWIHSLKNQNKAPNSISITLGTFILGSIMALFMALDSFSDLSLTAADIKIIILFLGLGILSTAVPTLAYNITAKRLTPLMTTGILLFEPIFAILFAFLILKEIPSFWIAPGVLFILTGLLVINRKPK